MQQLSRREIDVRLIDEGSYTESPRVELILSGAPTGVMIEGAVLESALRCGADYLLFVTDDVPYEEALSIYLFDQALQCLDRARLGGMYATGVFLLEGLSASNDLRFRFLGDQIWSLRLLSAQVFRIPMLGDPPGVVRPFGFTKRFRLSAEPDAD